MESTQRQVPAAQRPVGPTGADTLGWRRHGVFAGVVIFLLGEAYDTYWHAKNVSFVVEPPGSLWTIHLGIYLGAVLTLVFGATLWKVEGFRVTGVLLVLGGGIELAGFFLDMWKHSQGTSLDLFHDLVWYGFGLVVVAVVRVEAMRRSRRTTVRHVD